MHIQMDTHSAFQHNKKFCVDGNTGFKLKSRISYFIYL